MMLAATTVISVAVAPSAQAAPAPTPVRYTGGPYVAMGDSRASGGFFTPTPDYFLGCKRSAFNYPTIVAALTLPRRFVDTSCAGAQAPDLYANGQHTNAGWKPPQVHLVPRDAQLITVSIGGNDMRWGAILGQCTTAPFTDRFCRSNRRLAAEVGWRVARMENRVTPALRAIRRKAPHAQIIVVGIGGFMGTHGCWPMVPISDPDVRWMNRVFDRAGDALRRATAKVDGTFVDANRLSAGHDPCNLITPWYESALSNRIAYPYHINQAGAIAVAAMVNGVIRR
ncbi:SGNH/GDSL hydrolase family protein [Gordonia sp. OPL2]|uniref:SGNH/GDSL hydrolase family protein n=1 Tax=Gordonia sp. OPL2 TaxID=2486274 RepID=UPI0016561E0E|nr:SGNH/GDSL hydrolase family protein [Gordonia sp. OPL2]RPA10317.1 SGNH/GDSL hydrolase family protein [Gordonia sp. OPL2]